MRKFLPLSTLLTAAILTACGGTNPQVSAPTDSSARAEPNMQAQIVNGTLSVLGARPYQVALLKNGSLNCGGSLIAPNWVLTAAHCVSSGSATGLSIRAGSLYHASGGQTATVNLVKVHPSYNSSTSANDIALLRLSTSLTLNSNVALGYVPGNTPESILDVKGKFAIVSGWGKTSSSSGASSVLREVSIPITPNPTSCSGTPPANTICGEPYQGKDSCNGDSGGPLAQTLNNKWYVLGVVSYGPAACNGYGVYTRVNAFANWIQTTSGVAADNGSTTQPGNTAPVANFTSSVSGLSVSFSSTSTDAENNISTYTWNFGDGTTANGATASKTYAAAGTYNVTLTVTDAGGLSSTNSQQVTVSGGTTPTPTPGNETFTGTITTSGSYKFHTSSTGFYYAGGTIRGSLSHATGRDFDLYLQKKNTDGTWTYVIKAATAANPEVGSYVAAAGTYRWIVHSYSGTGSYTLTVTK